MEIANPTRLNDWTLRRPPIDQFTRLPAQVSLHGVWTRADGKPFERPTPFFWFDPAWHRYPIARCQVVEQAVAAQGVLVSALHRDLSCDDTPTTDSASHRIATHRPDRAGLSYCDLTESAVIDLRLLSTPDSRGGLTYEQSQWSRWLPHDPAMPPIATSAMLFPPEWRTLADVKQKVTQLRLLGQAAIVLSADVEHLALVLPHLVDAGLDGLIIRTSGDPLEALQLATQLCQVHRMQLWKWLVASEPLSAEDYVKCLALGASAIAIDWLANTVLAEGETVGLSPAELEAVRFGYTMVGNSQERFNQAAEQVIGSYAAQIRGLIQRCGVGSLTALNSASLQAVPSLAPRT